MYVDYGTPQYVKTSELRTLHKRFAELPVQAIKSKLYGITPVDDVGWSEEAIQFLYKICMNKLFVAEIISIKPEVRQLLLLDLFIPSNC